MNTLWNTQLTLSNIKTTLFAFFMITYIFCNPAISKAVQISDKNVDTILASNELVLINFYIGWDKLSKTLISDFDEAADIIAKEFPEPGKVVLGKVDIEQDSVVAAKYRIKKFPWIKVYRNGQPLKGVYKGGKSVGGLINFVRNNIADSVKEFKQLKELEELKPDKWIIIGYFDRKDQPEYEIFQRVATDLRDQCQFYVGFNGASKEMHIPGHPTIVFRKDKSYTNYLDEIYPGNLTVSEDFHTWASEKCDPLIKELSLENARELNDERLPLLALFHKQEDKDSVKKFKEVVQADLLSERENINFITVDEKKIIHPLPDLNERELPVIAIDSIKHVFLFPNFKDIEIPGKLKQFVQDLYSGKLHREFHFGPDREL